MFTTVSSALETLREDVLADALQNMTAPTPSTSSGGSPCDNPPSGSQVGSRRKSRTRGQDGQKEKSRRLSFRQQQRSKSRPSRYSVGDSRPSFVRMRGTSSRGRFPSPIGHEARRPASFSRENSSGRQRSGRGSGRGSARGRQRVSEPSRPRSSSRFHPTSSVVANSRGPQQLVVGSSLLILDNGDTVKILNPDLTRLDDEEGPPFWMNGGSPCEEIADRFRHYYRRQVGVQPYSSVVELNESFNESIASTDYHVGAPIISLTASPCGRQLMVISDDSLLRHYSRLGWAEFRLSRQFKLPMKATRYSKAFYFTAEYGSDGIYVVSASFNEHVPTPIVAYVISPDGFILRLLVDSRIVLKCYDLHQVRRFGKMECID